MEIFTRFINIEIGHQKTFSLEDGQNLFDKHLRPNIDDIVAGKASVRFLVPVDRISPNHDGCNNLKAEFFAGLFEPLLIALRDKYMPELKHNAKRDRFCSVKGKKTVDAAQAFKDILQTTAESYDPLEEIFWDKVHFGLYDNDGSIKMGSINIDREFTLLGGSREEDNRLFFWVYKLCKALDGCFLAHLRMKNFRNNDDIGANNILDNAKN